MMVEKKRKDDVQTRLPDYRDDAWHPNI